MIRPLGVLAPPDPEVARLKRRVTLASLAVALTLVALKLAALVMTGSVSILSSLVDSVSDSGASLVTLIAVAGMRGGVGQPPGASLLVLLGLCTRWASAHVSTYLSFETAAAVPPSSVSPIYAFGERHCHFFC